MQYTLHMIYTVIITPYITEKTRKCELKTAQKYLFMRNTINIK